MYMLQTFKKIGGHLRTPRIIARKAVYRLPDSVLKRKFMRYPRIQRLTESLNQISGNAKAGIVFVFPTPSCPWGYLFQRPQQLARALSARGYTVLYMVDGSYPYEPDWFVRGLQQIGDASLYLYNDGVQGEGLTNLSVNHIILWQYWPHQGSVAESLSARFSTSVYHIYDCIDDLSTFTPYPHISQDHASALSRANLILASADAIVGDLAQKYPDTLVVPNGVRMEDFERIANVHDDNDEKQCPIIGYYGAIADWFDFKLIRSLAIRHPNWVFRLIGEVYPEVTDRVKDIESCANIEICPRVPYSEIPCVLSTFDVAILPFVKNEITMRTSPVKVYEYLAGGKPTVSTDLPEVLRIPNVITATSYEDFESGIVMALSLAQNDDFRARLRQTASMNTWAHRVQVVLHRVLKDLGLNP